jgi:hypothetical protein
MTLWMLAKLLIVSVCSSLMTFLVAGLIFKRRIKIERDFRLQEMESNRIEWEEFHHNINHIGARPLAVSCLGLMELMRWSFWRVIRELRALEKEQNYNTKLQIDELEGVMNCEFNMTQNKIKLWDEELKKLMREKENNQYEK